MRFFKTCIAIGVVAILVILELMNNPDEFVKVYRVLSEEAPAVTPIALPPQIEQNLIDKAAYLEFVRNHDNRMEAITPFYWHVAKAGGTAVQTRYLTCFTLITASEIGFKDHENEDFLRIVHKNGSTNHMNVDVSTLNGIQRAKELHLVESHIPQLIFAPLFVETSSYLYDPQNQGIAFAMFRHPVERVVSLFYYLQEATWEPTYNPSLANMTLLEYANSPLIEANFVTRSLLNKYTDKLTQEDFAIAKEILRRKVIVGIVNDFGDSLAAFEAIMNLEPNWHVFTEHEDVNMGRRAYISSCIQGLRKGHGSNKHKHLEIHKNSEEYQILERKNAWDITLWDYIVELYQKQKVMLQPMIDEKKRSMGEIYNIT